MFVGRAQSEIFINKTYQGLIYIYVQLTNVLHSIQSIQLTRKFHLTYSTQISWDLAIIYTIGTMMTLSLIISFLIDHIASNIFT
jgi:hypothetical protein